MKPAGGVVRPPSHAGMVPSLLPAFSAPTGVIVVPSESTSAWVALAHAGPVATNAAAQAAASKCRFRFMSLSRYALTAGPRQKVTDTAAE